MAKRKLSRLEAFKLTRSLLARAKTESARKAVPRLMKPSRLKKEDADDVFIVVNTEPGNAEVKFQDGNLLVGPFDSEEAAQTAAGEDVVTVTGGEASGAMDGGGEGDFEPELHERRSALSNFLRTRPKVAEGVRRAVLARIKRESDALAGVNTDVKNGEGSTEDAAGAVDSSGVASFVNAADNGPNKLSTPTDSDPAAKDSDANVLESNVQAGMLVNVQTAAGRKVDTGLVESVRGGIVRLEGGEEYQLKSHRFERLAS